MSDVIFNEGDYVKWTSRDASGRFSYSGHIVSHTGGHIVMTVSGIGTITSGYSKGEWKLLKPADTAKRVSVTVTKPSLKKAKTSKASTAVKQPKGKLLAVIELLKDKQPASRKEAITMIVEAGLMSAAGASTYYNNAKKYLA